MYKATTGRFFKKVWRSNSGTQVATLVAKPLNLCLFTPLLLLNLASWESTVFFLFLNNSFFSDFVMRRIGGIFTRALSVAVGEASQENSKCEKGLPHPWENFWVCFKTLQRLQLFAATLTLLIVLFLNYTALRAVGNGIFEKDFSSFVLILVLGTIRPLLNSLGFAYTAAQRAVGNVAFNNRVNVVRILIQNLVGSLVLLLGGGLVGVLVVLILSELFYRGVIAAELLKLRRKTFPEPCVPSRAITSELFLPILKNIGSGLCLSSERLIVNLLPLYFAPALIGNYLFTRYLLNACLQSGVAPWNANYTVWIRQYVEGNYAKIMKSVAKAAKLSVVLYFGSVLFLIIGYSVAKLHFDFSKEVLSGIPLAFILVSAIGEYLMASSNLLGRMFDYNIDFRSSIIGCAVAVPLMLLTMVGGNFSAFLVSVRMPFVLANSCRGARLFLDKVVYRIA